MMSNDLDDLILVADVGATHLRLALVRLDGTRLALLRKNRSLTQQESSILGPIQRFLAEDPSLRPTRACLAGAGPVLHGRLHLTNAPWDMDGETLGKALGLPVQLINDFSALACGVLRLDLADPQQVTPILRSDDNHPAPDSQGLALVVGAGTGLGVGFVVPTPDGPRVFPSEGGHLGLPVFNEETLALWRYLQEGLPGPPGAELAVSGPGIGRLYRFLIDTQRVTPNGVSQAVLPLPLADQPAAIAAEAASDPACARTMALFVELYARVCAELCAAFLPTGGLFLAGGIAAKNESHFLADDRFITRFECNYLPHLDRLTRATPVFLVRHGDISLFGAAQALLCQQG